MPGGPLEVGYGVSYLSIAIPVLGSRYFLGFVDKARKHSSSLVLYCCP